jgi:hypothetical protein
VGSPAPDDGSAPRPPAPGDGPVDKHSSLVLVLTPVSTSVAVVVLLFGDALLLGAAGDDTPPTGTPATAGAAEPAPAVVTRDPAPRSGATTPVTSSDLPVAALGDWPGQQAQGFQQYSIRMRLDPGQVRDQVGEPVLAESRCSFALVLTAISVSGFDLQARVRSGSCVRESCGRPSAERGSATSSTSTAGWRAAVR